jgi:hypothetical protein
MIFAKSMPHAQSSKKRWLMQFARTSAAHFTIGRSTSSQSRKGTIRLLRVLWGAEIWALKFDMRQLDSLAHETALATFAVDQEEDYE